MLTVTAKRVRRCLSKLTMAVMVSIIVVGPIATPPPAYAGNLGPCSLISNHILRDICLAAEGATNPVAAAPGIPNPIGVGTTILGKAAKDAVQPVMDAIATAEGGGVVVVLQQGYNDMNKNSTPTLNKPWYLIQYKLIFGLGLMLAVALAFYTLFVGTFNLDLTVLVKVGAGLGLFVFVGGVLPFAIGHIVDVVDNVVTPRILNLDDINSSVALANIEQTVSKTLHTSTGGNYIVPLVVLFFGVIGGIIAVFELIFREGMLYIVVVLDVLSLATVVGGQLTFPLFWQALRLTVAVILIKPLMAFIYMIGIGILSTSTGLTPLVAGVQICVLAPMLTWGAYKRIGAHNVQAGKAYNVVQKHVTRLAGFFS